MLDEKQPGNGDRRKPDPAFAPDCEAQPPESHSQPEPETSQDQAAGDDTSGPEQAQFHESIAEEMGALIDDIGLYATAEIAFQRTRARMAGRHLGVALAFLAIALILLHITLIAIAIGLVIALEPVVSIWGAVGIVGGLLLIGVYALACKAVTNLKTVAEMFDLIDPVSPRDSDP